MSKAIDIPPGYRMNARGQLDPESMVKPIDKTRDELVIELIARAKGVSSRLEVFKRLVFDEINAFVELSAEQYNVKMGGQKGNITLHSYDGKYKVQVAIAERVTFDERLQAAKKLVDECIHEWSEGSRDEIKVLVNSAFETDKEGKINVSRVLGLRRLNITDKKWLRAMTAIAESVQVVGSKEYVRFYERDEKTGKYHPIRLDVAAV